MKKITLLSAILVGAISFAQTYSFTGSQLNGFAKGGQAQTLTAAADGASLTCNNGATSATMKSTTLSVDATTNKFAIVKFVSNTTSANGLRISFSAGNFQGTTGIATAPNTWAFDLTNTAAWTGTITEVTLALRENGNAPITTGGAFKIEELKFVNANSIDISETAISGALDSKFSLFQGTVTGGTTFNFSGTSSKLSLYKCYGVPNASTKYCQIVFNGNTSNSIDCRVSYPKASDGGATRTYVTKTLAAGAQTLEFDLSGAEYTGNKNDFQIHFRADAANTVTLTGGVSISSITFTATASTAAISKLEGVSVVAENGAIVVKGANLDAVYNVAGQKVGAENLASGIYIVKVSNAKGSDVVKIVL